MKGKIYKNKKFVIMIYKCYLNEFHNIKNMIFLGIVLYILLIYKFNLLIT